MISPNLSENLKIMNSCPVCKVKYNPLYAKVLDEKEGAHLMHIQCKKCKSAFLILVFVNTAGINSIGLITDLEADEVLKYWGETKIEPNDVLAAYQSLKKNINIFKLIRNKYGETAIACKNKRGEG